MVQVFEKILKEMIENAGWNGIPANIKKIMKNEKIRNAIQGNPGLKNYKYEKYIKQALKNLQSTGNIIKDERYVYKPIDDEVFSKYWS